ncbi:MAG: hypothetical protein WD182_00820 [Bacteroidota bacterium]
MMIRIGPAVLAIVQGDIAGQEVDAVVNAALVQKVARFACFSNKLPAGWDPASQGRSNAQGV